MKEIERLIDRAPDGLTARLLRAGRGDHPPQSSTDRAASAASVAGTLATSGSVTSGGLASLFVKGLGVLCLLGGGVATSSLVLSSPDLATARRPAPALEVGRASSLRAPPAAPKPAASPTGEPERAAGESKTAAVAEPVARHEPSPPSRVGIRLAVESPPHDDASETPPANPSASTGPSSFARELLAVDNAQRALDQKDLARATSLLDRYSVEFPHGQLEAEAAVLRIEAASMRADEAASLCRAFLAAHPESPLARRVRSLLAQATKRADAGP